MLIRITPSCSWGPIFPLSYLAALWATGAGVTVPLNLLYSFIIFWLFHGTIFFFDIWNFFISSPNTFQNPEWVSFSLKHKSAQQREKCKFTRAAKGIRSCYLVRSFYSSLWAAGLERKGARGVGSDRGIDSFSLALGAALPKLHTLPEFHPPLCPCPLSSTALPDSLQPSIYTECCVSSAPLENMSFVKQGLRPLSQSSTTSDMPYMLWGWLVTAQEIPDRHWSQIPV